MTEKTWNDKVSERPRRLLVTGGAGFIGSHLVDRLLQLGDQVVCLDSFHDFYSIEIKQANIRSHRQHPSYRLVEGDIRSRQEMEKVFADGPFDVVVHLAALAGVRPSLRQPRSYLDVNICGTQNLLDCVIASSRSTRFVFGSSSSVYGARSGEEFLETDRVDQPQSPYAASKAAAELVCRAAHHTARLPVVCLRFFTVFGPRQRPDLAIHKFCRLIDQDLPIEIYGDGTSRRDYTYIDDIIDGIEGAMKYDLKDFDIINLGRSQPVLLKEMIAHLEEALGKRAAIVQKPPQRGDVPYTFASTDKACRLLGYNPSISLEDGIQRFVAWYKENRHALRRCPVSPA